MVVLNRLVTLALLALGPALSMPAFRLQAIVQLHYEKDDPLWRYSGKVMACTFCHVNAAGGAPWNPFGQVLKQGFQSNPRARFGDVLHAVLSANGDADGDGYPDALEVFAHTLPGDARSKPDRPLAEVEEAFEAAGGIGQYAARKKK